MNHKQMVWVVFLVINGVSLLLFPQAWNLGGLIIVLLVCVGGILLSFGYLSYWIYKHLGDEPIELEDPITVIFKLYRKLRGLSRRAIK